MPILYIFVKTLGMGITSSIRFTYDHYLLLCTMPKKLNLKTQYKKNINLIVPVPKEIFKSAVNVFILSFCSVIFILFYTISPCLKFAQTQMCFCARKIKWQNWHSLKMRPFTTNEKKKKKFLAYCSWLVLNSVG